MFKIGIITLSDKGAQGEREDLSAGVIKEMVAGLGDVVAYLIIPDDRELIKETLVQFADVDKLDLVLTTGGTGLGPRDNTPEATQAVIHRRVPGLVEAMRMESLKKTSRAMLSRAEAGVRRQTLIVNLPGSPKGVRECLEVILPALPHGLEILTGKAGDCAGGR